MYNLSDHGFQVFSGVFKPAEITQMREKIQESFQRLSKQDLILEMKSKDLIREALIHSTML